MAPPPPKKPVETPKNTERNEYIPSFISKKPFYIDDETQSQDDYLEHQRLQNEKSSDPLATSKWYDRGQRAGPAATKYRKGACENCGAMTHKAKDCLYRTRKQGAKWTGKNIQADELVQDVKLGWDAKRDRWNGYDPSEFKNVVEEYNQLEEMKKAAGGAGQKTLEDGDEDGEGDQEDGTKYAAETDMGRHQPTSTRQLRLREDTAKYLLNLDLDSAKYDPKTRSMEDAGPQGDELDAGEGFVRPSSNAEEFEKAQRYAWENSEKGASNMHLQANPTAAQHQMKKDQAEAKEKKEAHRKLLMEKYGGQEHLQRDPLKDATVIENERYIEYDERGKLKGQPERKEKSMYAEDVMINNHTSVWGSWWKDFKWGYACCHSTMKNSYCVGEEGRKAIEESDKFSRGMIASQAEEANEATEVPKTIAWKEEEMNEEHVPNAPDRPEKLRKDADQQNAAAKRTFADMRDGVTEEEMDEYKRKKTSTNDPMANMLGKDELLE